MKLSRILLTGALSVSMLAMGAVSAFAEYADPADVANDGNTFTGKEITIPVYKVLKSNEGTTINTSFKYTVGSFEEGKDLPEITIADIDINKSSDKANVKGFSNMILPPAEEFGKPDTYVYKINETTGAAHFVLSDGEKDDLMTYDANEYKMRVFVYTDENGKLAYKGVTVESKKDGKKVSNNVEINEDGNTFDGVTFVNSYWKDGGTVNDPDPVDPENPDDTKEDVTAFTLSKTIDGDGRVDTDEFTFTVVFTLPGVVPAGEAAKPTCTGATVTGEGGANGTYTATVTLKGGEKAVFNNVIAGTKYSVKETPSDKNTATYTTTEYSVNKEAASKSAPTAQLITENANTLDVTNRTDPIDITGLVMNNAPYVALIALALAMAAAYIMIRRRKAGEME